MIDPPSQPLNLVFDGDRSMWGTTYGDGPNRDMCVLCGHHCEGYIRIRSKREGGTDLVGHVCPTCIVRMVYQVERLSWWNLVKTSALSVFKRLVTERANLEKRSEQTRGYFELITKGSLPKPKKMDSKARENLDKAIKLFPREGDPET
jgi:hypothetical protein